MDKNYHPTSGRPGPNSFSPFNLEDSGGHITSRANRSISGNNSSTIPSTLLNAAFSPPLAASDNGHGSPWLSYMLSEEENFVEHDHVDGRRARQNSTSDAAILALLPSNCQTADYIYPSIQAVLRQPSATGAVTGYDSPNRNAQSWPFNERMPLQQGQAMPQTPCSSQSGNPRQGRQAVDLPSSASFNRMPVQSNYLSSLKPGHDPPQNVALQGLWPSSLYYESVFYSPYGFPAMSTGPQATPYMTGPFLNQPHLRSPTEYDIANNYPPTTYYQGHNDSGWLSNQSCIFEPTAGRSIPVQNVGVSAKVLVKEKISPEDLNIDIIFLGCLLAYILNRQAAGSLQRGSFVEIDAIREDVKMAINQKLSEGQTVIQCKASIDGIFARFKMKVGSIAIRNDRDRQKSHDQTHWCPFSECGGVFTRSNGLKNHLAAHFDVKDTLCTKCHQWLRGPSSKRHIDNCKPKAPRLPDSQT